MGKFLLLIAFLVFSANGDYNPSNPIPVSQLPSATTEKSGEVINVTCTTPNNKNGMCISLDKCKSILAVLNKFPLSKEDEQFVRDSACPGGNGNLPNYCCNIDPGFIEKATIYFPPEHVPEYMPSNGVGKDIPNNNTCGIQSFVNKILSGKETDIFDFPWMVLIEHRKGTERKLRCAGSLINQRYVVTAAHCVVFNSENSYKTPILIRLGDHDLSTEIDCAQNDRSDCNQKILEIGIEKIIPHENFNVENITNDIALIRLNQNVPNDNPFIQPICLPSVVGFQKSEPGALLTVAGWGVTEKSLFSNVKLKVDVPVNPQNNCSELYAGRARISDNQICAGGKYLEDSCTGDSGGPLMASRDTTWVLEGIISFGVACGREGWPAVYTRVQNYESWIRKNLEE